MKMFSKFKGMFSHNTQVPTQEVSKSQTRNLMTEVAIYEVWDEMQEETDLILEKLSSSREDLKAVTFDDEVGAALETRYAALVSTPWRIEGDDDVVEFVTDNIKPFIYDIFKATFESLKFGYSVIELVFYKTLSGQKILVIAKEKPFTWFMPKSNGELLYLKTNTGEGVVVDQNKFILTTNNATYENPMGDAVLSRLYWPAYYKKHVWEFWLTHLDRFSSPTRVGKTPNGVIEGGKTRAEDLSDSLQSMAQKSIIVVSDDQEVELLEASSSGEHFNTIDIAANKRIQKTILGQTLTTDTQGVGSQALGTVHNEVKDDRRMSDVRRAAKTVQHIVNVIVRENFPGKSALFVMEDERGIEKERAERDVMLVNAGMIEFTEDYILDRYDLNPGDFIIPEKKAEPESVDNRFSFAKKKVRFTEDQQAIEDLIDSQAFSSPIDPQLIDAAAKAATSPKDLERRLAILLKDADVNKFSNQLETELFKADMMGYVNAE